MSDMTATTSTSPKERLAAYRRDARHQAAANGRPGDRAVFPGLSLDATGMIYLRGKQLMYQGMYEAATALDPARLEAALTLEDSCTVVADTLTFTKLAAMAETLPGDQYRTLSRRLQFSRGLPGSVKLPVLTEALAYRYWIPEGKDERSFEDWAAAFDVKGPSVSITMRALIELAEAGKRPEALKWGSTVRSLERTERSLMEQAQWGGLSSDVQLYGLLDGYGAAIGGLRRMDPALVPMHVIDGQVCRIVPMNETHHDFSASVSMPFKLKAGKNLRISDGTMLAETTLESLRYTEDSLHAVFAQPSGRGGGRTLIASAKAGSAQLYATEAPFAARSSIIKNRRWFTDPEGPVANRNVPLDVILAGAPTD